MPNSAVGRRISTSTIRGFPCADEGSSRNATMGCRCSANSSSFSARSMSPSRRSSRCAWARSCASSSCAALLEAQRGHDGGGAGGLVRFQHRHIEAARRLGQHRQHRHQRRHAPGAIVFLGSEPGEHHQQHAAEILALEQCKGTTCTGGIRALPPQAAGLPAHVVRFFDHFRDQRVIFREQEIRARPERMPERVVDRQARGSRGRGA